MELITAVCCWQIVNKRPRINRNAHRETQYRQVVHKLITSLHSKRYRPSSLLIRLQNSYAVSGAPVAVKRWAVEPVNKVKEALCSNGINSVTWYCVSVIRWQICKHLFIFIPAKTQVSLFMSFIIFMCCLVMQIAKPYCFVLIRVTGISLCLF
jgi:hypothetical protein